MTQHKFAIGQAVDFMPGPADANVPRGKYKVLRLIPSETQDLQYRVKHTRDGHERVVRESQSYRTAGYSRLNIGPNIGGAEHWTEGQRSVLKRAGGNDGVQAELQSAAG